MITVAEYLMGRDKDDPLDYLQLRNMADLLSRINHLLGEYKIKTKVTSGYRPPRINKTIGGAKMSTHTACAGIDLLDTDGSIGKMLKDKPEILERYGLWLEHPDYTRGWVHLDIKQRKNRVFIP